MAPAKKRQNAPVVAKGEALKQFMATTHCICRWIAVAAKAAIHDSAWRTGWEFRQLV
jgi:hypothetical protein